MATNRLDAILDIMRVPASGDPSSAVVTVDHAAAAEEVDCDILVVGGGMGGVAATLAATRRGRTVCLLEETDWLGGQMTSQGVAALDEHDHIESFGGTRTYYHLREAVRSHYRALADAGRVRELLNPGNCWVSRVAFEPAIMVRILETLLAPEMEAGRLLLFLRAKPVAVEMAGDRVAALTAVGLDEGRIWRFSFDYLLDATELGDLLPLVGAEHVIGAESAAEAGEPHAQPERRYVHCVQSCTYTFAMERRPEGEDHRIPRPGKYAHYRDTQPYALRIHVHGGEIYGEETGWLQYGMFNTLAGTKGGLWTYRRLVDAAQFPGHFGHDVTMFNWPGIDYRDAPLVEQTPEALARALQDAKRVSLGFIHWLQTEAETPDGGPGFPNLMLRPDVMGSADGLSKHPYSREGRRIRAVRTVREQDVAVAHQPGSRAAHFHDSVGVGWYPIDIHQAGEGEIGTSTRTKPFQIPLGALIPVRVENLIAANKNIGTTHITNGCYRVHPVEWNIGEAAGTLAAFALERGRAPKAVYDETDLLRAFQTHLLEDGVPLTWLIDVPVWHEAFTAVQRLVMVGGYGDGDDRLEFRPDAEVDAEARSAWLERAAGPGRTDPCGDGPVHRAAFAHALAERGWT